MVHLDTKKSPPLVVSTDDGVVVAGPVQPISVNAKAKVEAPAKLRTPLAERWSSSRVPTVTTAELPASIDELFAYTKDAGFFDQSTIGIQHHEGVSDSGRVDVMYAPNRRAAMRAQSFVKKPDVSVLLDPPNPDQRGFAWRDYVAWPNIFPYFPIGAEHTVITGNSNKSQTFDETILGDMLDWQAAASGPVSMLYNGMAGNSEDQLHWHSMKWRFPVERGLDDRSLPTTDLKVRADGRVATFEKGFFGGILIEGTRSFLGREASAFVDGLERRAPTSGKYNVLLLTAKNDCVRMVLIPRKPGIESREHGAVTMSGLLFVQSDPPADLEEFGAHARGQLIVPSQIPWLAQAANRPFHPRLATS